MQQNVLIIYFWLYKYTKSKAGQEAVGDQTWIVIVSIS